MGIINHLGLKKSTESEKPGFSSHRDFPPADFIPYATFFNDHTILTKNGELLQTIRIPLNLQGLPSEEAAHSGVYLRDVIRTAIGEHLTDPIFAHWMHVFRDRDVIDPLSKSSAPFAEKLHEDWLDGQHTAYSYHNVCYLTIIAQGQMADMMDKGEFAKASRKRKNRKFRTHYLQEQAEKLEQAVGSLAQDIAKHFKVDRLEIVERDSDAGVACYSEQLEWLHRLANLSHETMPVDEVDLSQQLDDAELIFGFDAMEARRGRQKRFASILSLKHYHELPVELYDRFIQMPAEMVITQASHFSTPKQVMGELDSIRKVLKQSEDGFIAKASGFIDVLDANQGRPTDFSKQQTTIMLLNDNYQDLNKITLELQTAIANLGLLSVREDIKMEEIFWSQLPGNFEFLRRMQALPTNKVDGFARLNFFPTGKHTGHWGEPITILPTETKTPYLFHFHLEQTGHTAIVDFNSFPDAMGAGLTHFLCATASKQTSRIIMFDRHGSGELFSKAMGGHYARVGGKQHNLPLNPLAMDCVPGNQGFLAAWLAMLLDVGAEDTAARDAIRSCIGQGWSSASSGGFADLVKMMEPIDPAMAGQLRELMQRPAFGAAMTSGLDSLDFSKPFSAVNIHVDAFREQSAIALFSLLLHRAILSLDGKPTILVIKDAWDVLDHPFFASRLKSLLDMLTERNAMLLVTTRDTDRLAASPVTPVLMEGVATKLIIPDDIPGDYAADILGYSKAEEDKLLTMERQQGEFLVVHGDEIIATKLEISGAHEHATLLGDAKTLQAMKSA